MVSGSSRFNIYLLLGVMLIAVTGCQSPEKNAARKREKQLATVRVHVEVNQPRAGQSLQVTVLRAAPILLNVEKNPFLNELHVASAEVVETPEGGYRLSIHLNKKGQWLLEQYTAAHPNRRLAIRCQWGVAPDVQDRFVAAPMIQKPIKDGILAFTPDATRDEAEQIAIGLNNIAGDTWLKEDTSTTTGGTK